MIELRPLGYFLCACEHENLGFAAEELDIAPSTLSASLKSLEQELGVTLLRKRGSGVAPQPAARWLFRAGLPLLLLERFACRRLAAPADAEATLLRLDIGLRFTFGRVSKAISHAIARTADEEPLVLVQPNWTSEQGHTYGADWMSRLDIRRGSRLTLDVAARPADDLAGEHTVLEDPWLLVRRHVMPDQQATVGRGATPRLITVASLPQPLLEQVKAYANAQGLGEVLLIEGHPGALPQLMEETPGAAFLMPSTVVAARLGMTGVFVAPLQPPLASTIVGRADPGDAVARRFLNRVREALLAPEGATAFKAEMTSRRVRYFNLAHEHGQVSAAARMASVAQPALSQQLQKLEATLGAVLFERRTYGLAPTAQGERFAPMAQLLERHLRELSVNGMAVSLAEGGRLSLGVLPSVSQHGFLVNKISDALLTLAAKYPRMRFTVQEAPNKTLQTWVTRGAVGLAIVDTALPQLPRMSLDAAEELSVIVDPRHGLLPPGPVAFARLATLPVVLPTPLFGLRQLVDEAANASNLEIQPRHEVDSLALLTTLLSREAVCTVLPASAVGPELAAGSLSAHPIMEPTITRKLFAIYSGDRSLTPLERELIVLLREGLSGLGVAEARDSVPVRLTGASAPADQQDA